MIQECAKFCSHINQVMQKYPTNITVQLVSLMIDGSLQVSYDIPEIRVSE